MAKSEKFPKEVYVTLDYDGDDVYLAADRDLPNDDGVRVAVYRLDQVVTVKVEITTDPEIKSKK